MKEEEKAKKFVIIAFSNLCKLKLNIKLIIIYSFKFENR